ncbi:MAG: LysR family transcriptional regulator [Gammaproteobacteria bacterium]|nr:LysR family transcriptional regulator [Gammaproteobacteria bacterium]
MGRYEQLEAFIEVVNQQSFSAAGDKLGVVKSVLSRRVSELESRLGVKLLNRTTRKLSLTGAGEQLYQQASVLMTDLLEAEQRVSDEQIALSGRLKIAAPLSFSVRHLSPAIAQFVSDHPDIDVSLDLNDREIDLVAEGYDLAIRIGELKDSTLIVRKLGVIRFATLASPEYLKKKGRPKRPEDLSDHDGLFYTNISDKQQWTYCNGKQTITVVPRNRLSANNGDFLAQAALDGLGIIQCPTFIVDEYIRDGRLKVLLQEFQKESLGIYALFPPGRLIPRRSRILVDFLQQQYGASPKWDQDLGF